MPQRNVRMSVEMEKQIKGAVEDRGLGSVTSFIRLAIQNELQRVETDKRLEALEERLAATLARQAEGARKLASGQQAVIALVDSLSKVVLTCVPEPEPAALNRAVAVARDRYQKFLKSAASSLKGDFLKSLTDIVQ
jgi:Arc/MetJ-type ribon-helix-helix transcriptional regulator